MSDITYDRKDLKILAYKDRLNEVLEENAELRVDLTVVSNQYQQAIERIQELETPVVEEEADASPEED